MCPSVERVAPCRAESVRDLAEKAKMFLEGVKQVMVYEEELLFHSIWVSWPEAEVVEGLCSFISQLCHQQGAS